MSTGQVSMLQKMETGFRIQDSGLFSTTRMDSATWIQVRGIQGSGRIQVGNGFRIQVEMDSGFS